MAHVASARPQPVDWNEFRGELRPVFAKDTPWEVICGDCGDDLGPFDRQTEHVRRVRGPYPNRAAATAAMFAHTGAESPG